MTDTARKTGTSTTVDVEAPSDTGITPSTAPRSRLIGRIRESGMSRIAGISASLVGTQALTSVIGLLFWTLAARQFLPAEVGIAGAAVSLMMLLGSLGSLGLGTVLIARLPMTDPHERRVLVRTALAAAAAGGAVLAIAVPLIATTFFGATALAPIAGSVPTLLGFAAGTALTSVVIVLDQAVLTLGAGTLQLERNVTASVVKVIAVFALALIGVPGAMAVFLAWAIGNAVSLPLVAWRTRGGRALADGRRLLEPRLLRGIGRLAVSHHALNVSIQAALQLLPVLVVVLVSAEANASFNAAIMVAGLVFALPYAVSIGLFAAARGDESEVISRMRLTIPFGLVISVSASLVLFPLAGVVLSVFGSQYAAQGADLLRLIVLAGVPFVIKDHFIALRRVQGRTTQALAMTTVFLVLELGGATVGAQLGGVVGLCIGWLAVLAVEALVLVVPIVRALRTPVALHRAPARTVIDLPDREREATPPTAEVAPTMVVRRRRTRTRSGRPGWSSRNLTGPTLFAMSLGVLVMAAAANAGRAGDTGIVPQIGWVIGLSIMFVPATLRIIARSASAGEQIAVAIGLGMMMQFSRLVINPTQFAFHDELIHLETLQHIDQSGHLFGFTSLLPVSAFYPGLEIATTGVEHLTGLPVFPAAVITLVLARLIMMLAIVGVVRLVTRSARAGAIGALVYMANPQQLFFNSQYSYQTLALPLALLSIYLFATRTRSRVWGLLPPLAATTAVIATHHLTGAFLVGFLGVWFVVTAVVGRRAGVLARRGDIAPGRVRRTRRDIRDLAIAIVVSAGTLLLSAVNPGNPLAGYLGAIAGSSGADIIGLTEGHQSKALFADSAGTGPAPWEQVLLIAAVLIATASVLVALGSLRTSWRAARPLALVLALLALLYPLIPAGHLTSATAEVGDRASGFVFIGTAAVVGGWWWMRRRRRAMQAAFLVGGTALFLGNIVLGAGPIAGQLPGPYQISADARSIDADNIAAASWLRTNVAPGSVVYGDRTSGLLAAGVGGQRTVLHVSSGVDASRLLLAPTVTPTDIALIRTTQLDYLIVDERMSAGLPHQKYYIESGEFGGLDRTTPVSADALGKFSSYPGVRRVYDNGSIVIYDVRGLR